MSLLSGANALIETRQSDDQIEDSLPLYQLLGVPNDATFAEIKAAYRQRSKELHPDSGGDKDAFIALAKAFRVLSDPQHRKFYDENGGIDGEALSKAEQLYKEILAKCFSDVLEGTRNQLDNVDIIGTMKKIFIAARQQHKAARQGVQNERSQYERLLKRISFEGKGENLFAEILNEKIDGCNNSIRDFELRIVGTSLCLTELEGYSSVVEMVQTYHYQFSEPGFTVTKWGTGGFNNATS